MIGIGIRVTPKELFFSVVNSSDEVLEIMVVDKIKVPQSLEIPDKLSYIRIALYTLINEYSVDNAVLRRMEDNTQRIDIFRANLEGVIQELISNCRISKYSACKLAQLASKLDCKTNDLKNCIQDENLFNILNWDTYKKEERESILCALASTEL